MKDYAKVVNKSRENQDSPDKKNTSSHARPAPKSNAGFFSLVAIFVLVAVLFAAYRQYVRHKAEMNPKAEVTASAKSQAANNPQFDFYSVLPTGNTPGANTPATAGNATNVPAAPPAPAPTTGTGSTDAAPPAPAVAAPPSTTDSPSTPAASPAPAAAAATSYYLNAGSFSDSADAQQMLSQLLLLGAQANITTTQDNGSPSYEVLVGPFDDQDAMNLVKQQLATHQIEVNVVQQ